MLNMQTKHNQELEELKKGLDKQQALIQASNEQIASLQASTASQSRQHEDQLLRTLQNHKVLQEGAAKANEKVLKDTEAKMQCRFCCSLDPSRVKVQHI